MINALSFGRQKNCTLLAILCGEFAERQTGERKLESLYPFPEIASSGRIEVFTLVNPTVDQFLETKRSLQPNFLLFQGEQVEREEEIGSLIWGTADFSDPNNFVSLISPSLPTIVYLEFPNSEKIAHALHSKGVPYVIYWKNVLSSYAASHFRNALLSVVQSSCSHTWDAFQLAHASFQLYCVNSNNNNNNINNSSSSGGGNNNNNNNNNNNLKISVKFDPRLLGDAPKINLIPPETEKEEDEKEEDDDEEGAFPSIKIYDEDVDVKLLVCGSPCIMDASLLGALEDGLTTLLNIEIRGSKLQNRVSAAPPADELGSVTRGVVTMRCDITTCSSVHISLLVSGTPQTCFNDQHLETHIKKELIERSKLVRVKSGSGERKQLTPLNSVSVACGAPVIEVSITVPKWAAQVLKHLARDVSYRSLVPIGIASVQGTPVASFEKSDADRLLYFYCSSQRNVKELTGQLSGTDLQQLPRWSCPLTKERTKPGSDPKPVKLNMRPMPRSRKHRMSFLTGLVQATTTNNSNYNNYNYINNDQNGGLVNGKPKRGPVRPNPVTNRREASRRFHSVPLNPLPMKKHGCNRLPIRFCTEEEFLKDVMQFLIQRGRNRLVPQGGISDFPDAILNAKRLDLYNLYKEVVTRGGFYVGNGINWKGQVFPKMSNHTAANRMTGVGNTLKRHYETYLLEYELAHDDVDGECCLLCRSSTPGDWVNCGLCGEWAHFGCDRRQGLGAFKDYAKTDGLEYICPHCNLTKHKEKKIKLANSFPTMQTVL